MEKRKRITALFLVLFMLVASLPMRADAASIKINKKSATIYVGSSTTLSITGTKKKKTWSSNKKSVATVTSKGKVTGKKAGTATITAKVGGKKYTCKVTVKNPYLNMTKKTVVAGRTFTLKITGTTAKKWTSNNMSVATVTNNGNVTTKKAGSATISCLGKNGKTYSCVVTVTAKTTSGANASSSTQDKEYVVNLRNGKKTTIVGHYDRTRAKEIFNQLNTYRANKGLSKLKEADTTLQAAADVRGYEIGYSFSHDRPSGVQVLESYFDSAGACAENIAYGYNTAASVMDAWKKSSGHNQNMLWNYPKSVAVTAFAKKTGTNSYTYYYVQLFGRY